MINAFGKGSRSRTSRALRGLLVSTALCTSFSSAALGGVEDPAPDGFKVVYVFTGARSVLGDDGSAATSIHCTNTSGNTTTIRTEFYNEVGTLLTALQLPTGAGRTVTFSSRATEFYSDNAGASLNMLMGSVRVLSDGSPRIVCTGQVLDPIGDPPSYIVALPGFSRKGTIK